MVSKNIQALAEEIIINSAVDNEITIHDDVLEVEYDWDDNCDGTDKQESKPVLNDENNDFEWFDDYNYDYNDYDFYNNIERDYVSEYYKWLKDKNDEQSNDIN